MKQNTINWITETLELCYFCTKVFVYVTLTFLLIPSLMVDFAFHGFIAMNTLFIVFGFIAFKLGFKFIDKLLANYL